MSMNDGDNHLPSNGSFAHMPPFKHTIRRQYIELNIIQTINNSTDQTHTTFKTTSLVSFNLNFNIGSNVYVGCRKNGSLKFNKIAMVFDLGGLRKRNQ